MQSLRLISRLKPIADKFSKYLPIVLILMTVGRILIGLRIPYLILADQFYDDRMMYENALNIVNGVWLGPYDAYALTKGIGYSLFLILAKKLCIPYSLLLAILNVAGAYLLTKAISEVIRDKYACAVIYGLLLFSPINLTMFVTQRLYRMAIIPSMVEIVFAGMIGLTLRRNCSLKKQLPWSILAGISLAFFWQIREDSIWILPFVAVLTIINVICIIFFCREKAKIQRILLAVLPVVFLLAGNLGVAAINQHNYGVFVTNDRTDGSFGEMMSLLYRIEGEESTEDIWITKDVIYQAEEVSPTLQQVKPVLDRYIDDWAGGEEIKGDHYSWVIRGAVETAGFAPDAVTAEQFYASVVEELHQAIDTGVLRLKDDGSIYFSSQAKGIRLQEIPGFLGDALLNIWEIAGYTECALDGGAKSTGAMQDIRRIEAFTSGLGIYQDSYTVSAKGWIFAKDDDAELTCILSRTDGEQMQGIILHESGDVAESYQSYANASNARLAFEYLEQEEASYVMDVYLDGIYYTTLNFEDYEDNSIVCRVENFQNERLFDYNAEYSSGMVSLANKLNQIYQIFGKPCFVVALLCFAVLAFWVITGLFHKRYDYLEMWVIMTGVLLSAVLLRFGNSLFTSWFTEDMQKFINSFYSCGVYILIQIFKYLSIATFLYALMRKCK